MNPATAGRGLHVDRVFKHYGAEGQRVYAVDGISLRVEPGEMVALYGPSGSGKSTLLLLAAALLSADAGRVTFDGIDLAGLSERAAAAFQRRDVGFIYQAFHLLPGVSAIDNAAIKLLADRVPLREARRMAAPWLDRVGLEDRHERIPERLSGGERQRVAIARALINEPRLLLADEPTGSLDSRRGAEILRLLSQTCHQRGAACLLVTHDPQTAAIADRVLVLRDGKLRTGHRPEVLDGEVA